MVWVGIREGVIQLIGTGTVGLIVSKEPTAPAYNTVRNLPGFYTRVLSTANTRTAYLSMTDKMTTSNMRGDVLGNANPRQSRPSFNALQDFPQIMHPAETYRVYVYDVVTEKAIELADATGANTIASVEFTTASYPTSYDTSRNTNSAGDFVNTIRSWDATGTAHFANSAYPKIQMKDNEAFLLPFRPVIIAANGMPLPGFLLNFGNSSQFILSSDRTNLGSLIGFSIFDVVQNGPQLDGGLLFEYLLTNLDSSGINNEYTVDNEFGGSKVVLIDWTNTALFETVTE